MFTFYGELKKKKSNLSDNKFTQSEFVMWSFLGSKCGEKQMPWVHSGRMLILVC